MTSFLEGIAKKFGIVNANVISNAKELLGKLESGNSLLNCSESTKAVICLDLACSSNSSGGIISRPEAFKYAGVGKSVYLKQYNVISKLLNLDKVYTVQNLTLQLNVSEVAKDANDVFDSYAEMKRLTKSDLEHPMYVCGAILASCKRKKLKVDEMKLQEISRLKKSELNALVKEISESLDVDRKRVEKKRIVTPAGAEDQCLKKTRTIIHSSREDTIYSKRNDDDGYEAWKKRMLEE